MARAGMGWGGQVRNSNLEGLNRGKQESGLRDSSARVWKADRTSQRRCPLMGTFMGQRGSMHGFCQERNSVVWSHYFGPLSYKQYSDSGLG